MVQFKIARLILIALMCVFSLAPMVLADNTVRASKNPDGSTRWEAIDNDSVEAGATAPPVTYRPAPVRSGAKTHFRTGGGGGISVHKNKDGSVETYCAGPSGIIPPGGFTDDGPIGDSGGYSGGGGGSYSSRDGVTVTRNADGSVETSSAGPSGSWGGGGNYTHRRRPVTHKVARQKAAPHKRLQAMQAKVAPAATQRKTK